MALTVMFLLVQHESFTFLFLDFPPFPHVTLLGVSSWTFVSSFILRAHPHVASILLQSQMCKTNTHQCNPLPTPSGNFSALGQRNETNGAQHFPHFVLCIFVFLDNLERRSQHGKSCLHLHRLI